MAEKKEYPEDYNWKKSSITIAQDLLKQLDKEPSGENAFEICYWVDKNKKFKKTTKQEE